MKITLGPKGRNVVLGKKFGAPVITNDGVTIAVRDQSEATSSRTWAQQLVRESQPRIGNDAAGDGTTTATVLAQAMVTEGQRRTLPPVYNPMDIRRGMRQGCCQGR